MAGQVGRLVLTEECTRIMDQQQRQRQQTHADNARQSCSSRCATCTAAVRAARPVDSAVATAAPPPPPPPPAAAAACAARTQQPRVWKQLQSGGEFRYRGFIEADSEGDMEVDGAADGDHGTEASIDTEQLGVGVNLGEHDASMEATSSAAAMPTACTPRYQAAVQGGGIAGKRGRNEESGVCGGWTGRFEVEGGSSGERREGEDREVPKRVRLQQFQLHQAEPMAVAEGPSSSTAAAAATEAGGGSGGGGSSGHTKISASMDIDQPEAAAAAATLAEEALSSASLTAFTEAMVAALEVRVHVVLLASSITMSGSVFKVS